jgi:hypothetical protein
MFTFSLPWIVAGMKSALPVGGHHGHQDLHSEGHQIGTVVIT